MTFILVLKVAFCVLHIILGPEAGVRFNNNKRSDQAPVSVTEPANDHAIRALAFITASSKLLIDPSEYMSPAHKREHSHHKYVETPTATQSLRTKRHDVGRGHVVHRDHLSLVGVTKQVVTLLSESFRTVEVAVVTAHLDRALDADG